MSTQFSIPDFFKYLDDVLDIIKVTTFETLPSDEQNSQLLQNFNSFETELKAIPSSEEQRLMLVREFKRFVIDFGKLIEEKRIDNTGIYTCADVVKSLKPCNDSESLKHLHTIIVNLMNDLAGEDNGDKIDYTSMFAP